MTDTIVDLLAALRPMAQSHADPEVFTRLIEQQAEVTHRLLNATTVEAVAHTLTAFVLTGEQPFALDSLWPMPRRRLAQHLPALVAPDPSQTQRLQALLAVRTLRPRHYIRQNALDDNLEVWFDAQQVPAFTLVALWHNDQPQGYLLLADRDQTPWQDSDLRLLQGLAETALAQLAMLDSQDTSDRTQARLQAADAALLMQKQSDMHAIMQVTVESLVRSVGPSRARIQLGIPTPEKGR